MPDSRGFAFLLLALTMLFWAGNWVLGRALRDAMEPFTLNFVRWALATLVLAPFALPGLRAQLPVLGGVAFLFVISALGTLLLLPAALISPPRWPGTAAALGVGYIAVFASILAFIFWNRGVAIVGASAAGVTLHLLPLFGTALAILFLGESFQAFHAVGFATILAGVIVATRRP